MKQIGIENKSFFLKIGCEDWEKEKAQEVLITIIIHLKNHQRGCFTDNIDHVYCNSQMIKIVEDLCKNEYNLIEFFAFQIKEKIIKDLNILEEDEVSVKVFKKSYQSFCVV